MVNLIIQPKCFTDFKSPVAKLIAKQIARGGDWKWAFDGTSGSGKSTACLRIAWDFDRDINGKRRINPSNLHQHVFFSSKELIKALYDIPDNERGHVLIWEEAAGSKGANARTWWSKGNNDIVEVFQICRIKGVLLIVNMQSLINIDKAIRSKFHMHSTCKNVVYESSKTPFVVTQTRILKPHYYKPEAYSLPISFINYESGLRHIIREYRIKVAPDKMYQRFNELELAYKKFTMKSKIDSS